ncbi:hypothetical protein DENIS_2685 [Desulfonema ishimotonii]|uniref:NACHT domain-containing protein n=1 Tax=Desulfonema ishimotonii TaxID=45657 RepID=A0A401FXR3_9BACT|nr:restriction endonuclease [Desulfonema ishimotonii]GBC61723.1 hypothetical protein DENIS_2685 [Desulfonema ishimotonii]
MNWDNFLEILTKKLKHSGKEGFEGLTAKLLEHLTGRKFFLSLSGRQYGRDMSSEEIRGNIIAVECKRYSKASLRERELIGELREALLKMPDLDLWVLLTTQRLNDQAYSSLKQIAHEHGIEFLSIDVENEENSDLAALCANAPDIVINHFRNHIKELSRQKLNDVEQYLIEINKKSGFSHRLEKLKDAFSQESLGFDNWRFCQNEWLIQKFESERESRAAFGQILNIRQTVNDVIPRKDAISKIRYWWGSWKNHKDPFVILGEEGDGKTWAIASFAEQLAKKQTSPPIIFITSNLLSSDDPFQLIVNTLKKQLSEPRNGYWEKRLKNWLKRPNGTSPLCLLVLDGLNEYPTFNWRNLLEALDASPWFGRFALLISCRSAYWERHLKFFHGKYQHVWELPGFNQTELSLALDIKGLKRTNVENLLPLISKPRYFSLMIRLKDQIAESGDITIERLFYEDWKDRVRRKNQRHTFSDDDFQYLITEVAQKLINNSFLKLDDVKSEINSDSPFNIVEELVSSRILVEEKKVIKRQRYKIDNQYLIYGLGLLLLDETSQMSSATDQEIDEAIFHWIEPKGSDLQAKILGTASALALIIEDCSENIRNRLLLNWVSVQNFAESAWWQIPDYFSVRPETYLNIAEKLWSSDENNGLAQDLLMEGFLKYGRIDRIQKILIPYFERWMGFIHLYGYAWLNDQNGSGEKEKERQKIADRIGISEISPGPLNVEGYDFEIITDEKLLRLSRLALAVISHLDRKPFIRAITIGIISKRIVNRFEIDDLFSWTLRTAPDDIWLSIKSEAEQLLKSEKHPFRQSGYKLLTHFGSLEAYRLREKLPVHLIPKAPLQKEYEVNPCDCIFYWWTKENYWDCLSKSNQIGHISSMMRMVALEPNIGIPNSFLNGLKRIGEIINYNELFKSEGKSPDDSRFDEYETVICAFAPEVFADILRNLALNLTDRNGRPLFQAAKRIRENMLIMTEKERYAIFRSWTGSLGRRTVDKYERLGEDWLFTCVIEDKKAEEQIKLLLARGDNCTYPVNFMPAFKTLPINVRHQYLREASESEDNDFIVNVLWFISLGSEGLSDYVESLLEYENTLIKASLFAIILKIKNQSLGQKVINEEWHWSKDKCAGENYFGSLILCNYGGNLTYSEILQRIYPMLAGYALEKRGYKQNEILEYADYLMKTWESIQSDTGFVSESTPIMSISYDIKAQNIRWERRSLSHDYNFHSQTFYSWYALWGGALRSSLPASDNSHLFSKLGNFEKRHKKLQDLLEEALNSQSEKGNHWFGNVLWIHGLKKAIQARKEYIGSWLNAVLPETEKSYDIIRCCGEFYEVLCIVLLEIEPEKGRNLYKLLQSIPRDQYIDRQTEITSLKYRLFCVPRNEVVIQLWQNELEHCQSNIELGELTFLIEKTSNIDWLFSVIEELLSSKCMYDHATGLKLLSLLNNEEAGKKLEDWIENNTDSWPKRIGELAFEYCFKKNIWAKWWFKDFLTNSDKVRAWGSFRVFLKCADLRFWLWCDEVLENNENLISDDRKQYYFENIGQIQIHIKENSKNFWKLHEKLLDMKVQKDQIWPWMDKYI